MKQKFKIGDKVIIFKHPTIHGKPDLYDDRKKGDIRTIKEEYGDADPTIGVSGSNWIIDKDCLRHYKIESWRKELE